MSKIFTHRGTEFDFLNPENSYVDIEIVANALSKICRFTGQIKPESFYSVAQHSVYVSYLVPYEHQWNALLHDSAEAFIGDVSKPLKNLLPDYQLIEERVEKAVAGKLGYNCNIHPIVKKADNVMRIIEQEIFFPFAGNAFLSHRKELEEFDLDIIYAIRGNRKDLTIMPLNAMDHITARNFFLARYEELKEFEKGQTVNI